MLKYYDRKGAEISAEKVIQSNGKPAYLEERFCSKCHGAGRGPWFPDGGVCYRCHGTGGRHFVLVKVYTLEQIQKLNAAQEKREAKKKADLEVAKKAREKDVFEKYGFLIMRMQTFQDQNSFLDSLLLQLFNLKRSGSLSEKQIEAAEKVLANLERRELVKEMKGEAPDGKQTVQAVILSVKRVQTRFGDRNCMLLKLDNFSTVYGTCSEVLFKLVPSDVSSDKYFDDFDYHLNKRFQGKKIEFTATFERSSEAGHSFFKRPSGVKLVW